MDFKLIENEGFNIQTKSGGVLTMPDIPDGSTETVATKSDTTLTKSTVWNAEGLPDGFSLVSVDYVIDEWIVAVEQPDGAQVQVSVGGTGAETQLSFELLGRTVNVAKTEAYILGSQSEKPLATAEQGKKAETAIQGVKLNGDIAPTDSDGIVDLGDISTELLVKVYWSDLVELRDDGNLVPGQQYRITDYVATSNGDMASQSANHPFDIIVTADDERTLNEHARAIMHDGDLPDDIVDGETRTKYFAGCDLAAWDVWYCLDNDTTRFAWADSANGKGVIYRLVDEFQNDCPYDFKGIQFKAYGDTDDVWRYTFDSGDASGNTDLSKSGLQWNVYNNTIAVGMYSDGLWKLNRIVFKGFFCYSNTFGSSCSDNTFGSSCSDNTFGSSCSGNTFGSSCSGNTFGSHCSDNTFGSNCSDNTFGSSCSDNTFGSNCSYNTFSSSCSYNTFGSSCSDNTFGSNCSYNTFGSYCYSGNWDLSQKYVGTIVKYDNALHVVMKQFRSSFKTSRTYLVGETLYYRPKYWECTTTHSGAWNAAHFTEIQLVGGILSAEEYVPLSRYRNVELENGVSYVALDCTADRGSVDYKNVTVSKGIAGTESAPKHIEDANYGQSFKTTYQTDNSNVISI